MSSLLEITGDRVDDESEIILFVFFQELVRVLCTEAHNKSSTTICPYTVQHGGAQYLVRGDALQCYHLLSQHSEIITAL